MLQRLHRADALPQGTGSLVQSQIPDEAQEHDVTLIARELGAESDDGILAQHFALEVAAGWQTDSRRVHRCQHRTPGPSPAVVDHTAVGCYEHPGPEAFLVPLEATHIPEHSQEHLVAQILGIFHTLRSQEPEDGWSEPPVSPVKGPTGTESHSGRHTVERLR